jgi:hypothetical protein
LGQRPLASRAGTKHSAVFREYFSCPILGQAATGSGIPFQDALFTTALVLYWDNAWLRLRVVGPVHDQKLQGKISMKLPEPMAHIRISFDQTDKNLDAGRFAFNFGIKLSCIYFASRVKFILFKITQEGFQPWLKSIISTPARRSCPRK